MMKTQENPSFLKHCSKNILVAIAIMKRSTDLWKQP